MEDKDVKPSQQQQDVAAPTSMLHFGLKGKCKGVKVASSEVCEQILMMPTSQTVISIISGPLLRLKKS